VFRWLMRNGAPILFTISVLIFLMTVMVQLAAHNGQIGNVSMDTGQSGIGLIFLLATIGNALSNSAVTFFGACLLYPLDRHWVGGSGT
jgi:hypothetical protein